MSTAKAPPQRAWRHRLTHLRVRTRMALVALVSVAIGLLDAQVWHDLGETPWLVGWLAYCVIDAAFFWRFLLPLDATMTRQRSQRDDPGAALLLALALAAACASLVAVAMAVQTGKSLHGVARWGHLALAAAALAAGWWLIQTLFARHYARVFYRQPREGQPALVFAGAAAPSYLDFLYHSCVVGMTSQVSDVQVQAREMRRLVLMHGVLSFAFNLVILALAVNVLAGNLS